MTRGLVLVVITHSDGQVIYSRYEGRSCTHSHACAVPLSDYWVQVIRNDPQAFYDAPIGADAA